LAKSLTKAADKDERFMRIAIELSKKSKPEDDRPHPKVGTVVVKEGTIIGKAFRGQISKGDHAEYTVLERMLGGLDLTGTTLYTTLEPCTTRSHDKVPCANRIIKRGIGRVVIGMLDPNPSIQGKGMYTLDEAGVKVQLAERLTDEIKELNEQFRAAQAGRESKLVEQQPIDPHYKEKFIEPMLKQVLHVIEQLKGNFPLQFSDSWNPDSIRTNPYFYLDSTLKSALEEFLQAYTESGALTAAANRAYEANCDWITRFHMSDFVREEPRDLFNRTCQRVKQSLLRTCLWLITDQKQLQNGERVRMLSHVREAMIEALGGYSEFSENVKRSANEIVNGLIKLNGQNNDIRNYVVARKKVETTAQAAHKLLWQSFTGSKVYQKEPQGKRMMTVNPAGRNILLPVKSFQLPPELGGWARSDLVAAIFFWQDSEMFVDICYDPDPKKSMLEYSGGALPTSRFLRIMEFNPEMRKYEFGITGRPSSILVVFFKSGAAYGFIGRYKLLESLRGQHADQMRQIIKGLTFVNKNARPAENS